MVAFCPVYGTAKCNRSGFSFVSGDINQGIGLTALGPGSRAQGEVYGSAPSVAGFYTNIVVFASELSIHIDCPMANVSGTWYVGSMRVSELVGVTAFSIEELI